MKTSIRLACVIFSVGWLCLCCSGDDESIDEATQQNLLLTRNDEILWIESDNNLNPYRVRLRNNLEDGFMIDALSCQWIKDGNFTYKGFSSHTTILQHTATILELNIVSSNDFAEVELHYRMEISENRMNFELDSSHPEVVANFSGEMTKSTLRAENLCSTSN
ncbi:MAG: hypothetical protein ACON42_02060 [Flavobacteriaceae bacterium]